MTCSNNMICRPERPVRWNWRAVLAALCLLVPSSAALAEAVGAEAFRKGLAALDRNDGIAAEVELRRALDAGMARPAVAARMGEAELLQGQLAEARRWLGPGQFSEPERAHGLRMLGLLEMREGNLPQAGKAFDSALKRAPRDAALWVDIGRLRYMGGEQIEAIDAVSRALSFDPANVRALEFQGQLVRDSYGPYAALPIFEEALRHAPQDIGLLGEYAATLGEAARAKEMLAVTRKILKLQPRNNQAFFLQAVLAARVGKDDLARRLLWRTDEAYRKRPAAMLVEAALELRAGNHAVASELFERLLSRQPDNERVMRLLARTLYEAGDYAELVTRFAPTARRDGAAPYLLVLVGRAYEALGDRAGAAPFLDRAAVLNTQGFSPAEAGEIPLEVLSARWQEQPGNADNVISYVRALLAQGQSARAVSVANSAVRSFPGSVTALTIAGDARLASGQFGAALEVYRRAALVRLTLPLVRRIATAYGRTRQDRAARELTRAYAAQHPLDRDAAILAAQYQAEGGDWKTAGVLALHAASLPGGERDPLAYSLLALSQVELGDPGGGLEDARAAYRLQRWGMAPTMALSEAMGAIKGQEGGAASLRNKLQHFPVLR